MDRPMMMYKGGQVPATHVVTVTAETNTELMEWEKGNIRGFIFEEIESRYDASMEEIFFHKKTVKIIFHVLAFIPSYSWLCSWAAGDPCSPNMLEAGIAIERRYSLDKKMKEKIPFIKTESIRIETEQIY